MANLTVINWTSDSLDVIRAKQELSKFLEEQIELKGKSVKIDAYHNRRIFELTNFIKGN